MTDIPDHIGKVTSDKKTIFISDQRHKGGHRDYCSHFSVIFETTVVVCIWANQRKNSLIPFFTLINTLLIGNNAFLNFITQARFFTPFNRKKTLKIGIQGNNLHIFP